MRRTKATLIYRRTKNLRAVQLLLGHTKLESTVRYLGIEVDDALEMAEQTEVTAYPGPSLPGQERILKSFQINDVHNIYSTPPSLKRGAWRAGNVSFRP
ncbi:hypothetical protein [Halomonas qinghailakensis]